MRTGWEQSVFIERDKIVSRDSKLAGSKYKHGVFSHTRCELTSSASVEAG